jgi:DNA modification methylase
VERPSVAGNASNGHPVSIGDLKPDPANCRKHNPRNIGSIVHALQNVGAARSIVIDEDNVILAGNGLVEAAGEAGIENVRIVEADGNTIIAVRRSGLTPKQKAELAIADNRTAELAEWDAEQLLATIAEHDIDLADVEFNEQEINALQAEADGEREVTEDEAPEAGTVPSRCKPGDLWKLGAHRLLCGDCREGADVATLLSGEKINVAVTSPPYASQRKYDESSGFKPIPPDEYVEWWEAVQANVRAYLAPDGSFFVNIKPHCEDGQRVLYVLDLVAAMVRTWDWRFVDEFCWKRKGVPGGWNNRFKNGWEPVYHFTVGEQIKFHAESVSHETDRMFQAGGAGMYNEHGGVGKRDFYEGLARPDNVLDISENVEAGTGHTAAYPVGLPAFFIKAFSDPGDVVLDPFAGSGTTLIACEQLGRRCFGLEISPTYCDVILARWEKLTGKVAERVD